MGINPFMQKKFYPNLYKPQLGDLIALNDYGESIAMIIGKESKLLVHGIYEPWCEEDAYAYRVEWIAAPHEYERGHKELLSYDYVNQFRQWYLDYRKKAK